jgi:hypothetical protein
MKTRRVAIYLRVSTVDQNTDNQEHELRQVAERAGWDVIKVYGDQGISGAKGSDKRPQFDGMPRRSRSQKRIGGPEPDVDDLVPPSSFAHMRKEIAHWAEVAKAADIKAE